MLAEVIHFHYLIVCNFHIQLEDPAKIWHIELFLSYMQAYT